MGVRKTRRVAAYKEAGFTLVELLVTMTVMLIVIIMAAQVLVSLIGQFKQQSKIAETNIGSVVGLEVLRRDLQSAGYALPWSIPNTVTYSEAASAPSNLYDSDFTNTPSGVQSGTVAASYGANYIVGSDYLVIRSASVSKNNATDKFSMLYESTAPGKWEPASENLQVNYRTIVISPAVTNTLSLVTDATDDTDYQAEYSTTDMSDFAPASKSRETYLIYGIDDRTTVNLRMPFNRADYFISNSTSVVPARCAPGIGVLIKGVIDHDGGDVLQSPLLDCVADFQIVYGRDTDDDGTVDTSSDNLTGLSAEDVREQVKEIRLYLLSHEGQIDPNFTYGSATVVVGPTAALGRTYTLPSLNYRWKLYTLVEKPRSYR